MKKVEFSAEIIRSGARKAISVCRMLWKGYGYYISLACLITLFGITAYIYRNETKEVDIVMPATDTSDVSVMAMLQSTAEPTPAPTPYSPCFIMPVKGDIINGFSYDELLWNETLGQWRVHPGIDINAASGTSVMASENGTIGAVYTDDLTGNVIEIVHEDGWISRYCGLGTLQLVQSGMSVVKGDIISSVGNSGIVESAIGPHLHFELYHNGEAIEPEFE